MRPARPALATVLNLSGERAARGSPSAAAHPSPHGRLLLTSATIRQPAVPTTNRFRWSLIEIEQLVRRRELSPTEVLQQALGTIKSKEPDLRAWAHLDPSSAVRAAERLTRELSRSGPRSPLHGVPVAVKDIFDTRAMPTEWGSPTQRGRQPSADCELVERLNSLGCVILGKTHTAAYAFFDPAPTRNPHDLAHTPGGSSSGSAAAVAAGMAPLAVGSQTQGSVLRPASFCGVTGFKPSHGLLPLNGVMPFAPTLDHAGLFAGGVRDLALAWSALGFAASSESADEVRAVDWPPGGTAEAVMQRTLESSLQALQAFGIRVRRFERPRFFDALPAALRTVMAFEAVQEHWQRYVQHGPAIGSRLASLLEEGSRISCSEYAQALAELASARDHFEDWMDPHAVVATPAAPGPAPAGLESTGDPSCNAPFTALGAPSISIPMPVPEGQLPMGLQLAAGRGRDALLLATAHRCSAVLARGLEVRASAAPR